jgi:hypothetical protein
VLDLAPHAARWCSMPHFCCALVRYAAANCLTLVVGYSTKFFPEEILAQKFLSGASLNQR